MRRVRALCAAAGVVAAAASAAGAAGAADGLPPLGSIVTLGSVTAAGQFLRHCDWQAFATPSDGSDDFHFLLVRPLNGAPGAVSFESVNYPGYFLTPGQLGGEAARLLAVPGPAADDASYAAAPVGTAGGAYTFASLSKNASYAGGLVSLATSLTGGCAGRYAPPAGDVILAPPGAVAGQAWTVAALPPLPPAVLTINTSVVDHVVPKGFFGCHADPGYGQSPLAFTPSMVYGPSFEGAGVESSVYAWNPVASPGAEGAAALDPSTQVNPRVAAPALKLTLTSTGGGGGSGQAYLGWAARGIGNAGLAWTGGADYVALAVVLAPAGATLYLGAHDRTAGAVHASATVAVPASQEWQVVNVSLAVNGTAGCVGIANGSDPTVSCTTTAGDGGSGPATNPGQVCVRCDGEYVVGLAAPGSAWVGFADLRPGAWGVFGPRGLAQARTVDALAAMGVAAIRQGGTVSQTFAWKDWRGPPWARGAMQHYWEDRLIPSTWGPFEFIETANAAGIEPVLTLAYDLNTAGDWADLVEYCWGNASTPWGAVRAVNDSHPEPYEITTFELGNEQENPDFVAQVAAMEARAAAVGAPPLTYVYPAQSGFPAATAAAVLALGGPGLAARVAPDIHIWGASGGVEAARSLAAGLPDFPQSFVNMEINARTSNLGRAVAEAADLQDWLGVGGAFLGRLRLRTTSFCVGMASHYDGYDQQIAYFLPNMTWLQPPGYVHVMAAEARAAAPNALASAVTGAGATSWLAASAQLSDDRATLVVQLVNTNAAGLAGNVTIALAGGGFTPSGPVRLVALGDPGADAAGGVLPNATAGNTPARPAYVAPAETAGLAWPPGAPSWTVTVPSFTYWVLHVAGAPPAPAAAA